MTDVRVLHHLLVKRAAVRRIPTARTAGRPPRPAPPTGADTTVASPTPYNAGGRTATRDSILGRRTTSNRSDTPAVARPAPRAPTLPAHWRSLTPQQRSQVFNSALARHQPPSSPVRQPHPMGETAGSFRPISQAEIAAAKAMRYGRAAAQSGLRSAPYTAAATATSVGSGR